MAGWMSAYWSSKKLFLLHSPDCTKSEILNLPKFEGNWYVCQLHLKILLNLAIIRDINCICRITHVSDLVFDVIIYFVKSGTFLANLWVVIYFVKSGTFLANLWVIWYIVSFFVMMCYAHISKSLISSKWRIWFFQTCLHSTPHTWAREI